ncbi:DUF885 family protein [Sphingomonas sp. IC081]|uniref:DUF885 domain-containing protein n=1 Tax=Sphingomonas sp. IC081 TaxID=304378 RepID=UPI0021AE332C|nr:DUF885 domain-containing protein [Sphingomonas sp. IC081]
MIDRMSTARRVRGSLALALLLCTSGLATSALAAPAQAQTPVAAAPSAAETQLQAVLDAHWTWTLTINPFLASTLGDHGADGKMPDMSLAAADRNAAQEQRFYDQLAAIPDAQLSEGGRTNKGVLMRMLKDDIDGNRFGERMMLFTTYSNWAQGFADLANSLPLNDKADYQSYLDRLAQFPRYNAQALEISNRAIAEGYVLPCAVLGNTAQTLSGPVEGRPEDTRFYAPFTRTRPASISEAEWSAMQARAVTIIRDTLTPEYRGLRKWFEAKYQPACRKNDSASTLPQGKEWYALQARIHTTTDLTPDQIHQIGLDEVKRITARMDAVAGKAGYANRADFIRKIQSDPQYFAKSPEDLLAVAALQAKRIDGMMPRYFGKLPRLPYGIKPIPAETAEGTTTAYYFPGSPEAGIAGNYYVNTSKLDQRPLWELPALTAHEAVPGHHNQIALQQEQDLPPVRKYAAGFTAFVEGWGLYSEYLGEEMGLYDTNEKMMGRLSYELWRACRLVVDTGIHAKGWDKARAVAFMKANTALTDANIDAEVNRYISWPGQALGYKIGEIRIRELRGKAEKALGDKFDLRAFHDLVLSQGPVPLDVLSASVDRWIAAKKAA